MTGLQHMTTGDGCPIAWRFDGPEQAPVLVLSNSLGTDMAMWAPQIEAFSAKFRVLRYDSRGHGASGAPAGAYSMDRLGRDVIELLDALGLERVAFCGLSKGGMVGQWLGYRAPERISALVLANTAPYMGPPTNWDARIATVRTDGLSAIAAASVARWFTPGFVQSHPAMVAEIEARFLSLDAAGYAGCCAAIRDMDLRATAPLISPPALVVGGLQDGSTPPEQARALVAAIPAARLSMLEAAHLSNVEQPDAFAEAVLEFLDSAGG